MDYIGRPTTVQIIQEPQPLSLGCERSRWFRCQFRDDAGDELEGKEKIGNLCPIPPQVKLDFQDIKPAGFVMYASKNESDEDTPGGDDGDHAVSFNVMIEPSKDAKHDEKVNQALEPLRKKAGKPISGECTLVFTHKDPKRKRNGEGAGDEGAEKRIEKRSFRFEIEAGTPHDLAIVNSKSGGNRHTGQLELEVENRRKLAPVNLTVVDKWGCRVATCKGQSLIVHETLVYKGSMQDCGPHKGKIIPSSEIKARSEASDTLKTWLRELNEQSATATIGDRRISLSSPHVQVPENHELICKLATANSKEQVKMKNNPFVVSIVVKPSSSPQQVRVWLGNKKVESTEQLENPLPTRAGSQQTDVKFEFLDEAERRVELAEQHGWTVSGASFGKKEVPCVCKEGFLKMPPIAAREKAGDSSEHAFVFRGPAGEKGDTRSSIPVVVNVQPVPSGPSKWILVEVPGGGDSQGGSKNAKSHAKNVAARESGIEWKACSNATPVKIRSGQLLRELLCVRMLDEFDNYVSMRGYHTELFPRALTSSGPEKKLQKVGDWRSLQYNEKRDVFEFPPDTCMKGVCGPDKMNLRILTSPEVKKDEDPLRSTTMVQWHQTVLLTPGAPHRVRWSMSGYPLEVQRESVASDDGGAGSSVSQKSKTLTTEVTRGMIFNNWPAVSKIEELCLEVVDEIGNVVDVEGGARGVEACMVLALRPGKLCWSSGKGASSGVKEELELKLDKKDWTKKLKKVPACVKTDKDA